MTDTPPLLGAYAAKQCPVRLFRHYDPTEAATASVPDEDLQQLFDDGIAFEGSMVEEIAALHARDDVAIIPGRDELDHPARRQLTNDALAASVTIICGALMEPDLEARRLGEIDLIVATGRTVSVSGKPEYRAIDVKSHRCTDYLNDPDEIHGGVSDLQLAAPVTVPGYEPRYREDDCLQLAHYHRLLQALGHAEPDDHEHEVFGGILGSERVVAWFNLQRPQFATLTPQENRGSITYHRRSHSTKRTALDRYDFEFGFRVTVIDAARVRTDPTSEPIVRPVKVKECEQCDWRDVCNSELKERDDVSLVKSVGYPEWRVYRFMGIETCAQLAALNPDEAVTTFADTPLTEKRIRTHINEARSAVAGTPIIQPTWDESSIPRGDIEIDLDMENADFVYLWGALLTKVPKHWPEEVGGYVPFVSFEQLDADGERRLATALWEWLINLVERANKERLTLRVYFYSPAETQNLRRLLDPELLTQLVGTNSWVDLLPYMRRKFWSNWGHGLKVTAVASGFWWRDDDPGGYASVTWYSDAMAGKNRDENLDRILTYNEDDCRATAALRNPVTARTTKS
ncbi:MAG: putative RecB family nuclease [Candidatus Aldehydirespiratoraceae bacterium]|jgi:predicted RecB family nuclease